VFLFQFYKMLYSDEEEEENSWTLPEDCEILHVIVMGQPSDLFLSFYIVVQNYIQNLNGNYLKAYNHCVHLENHLKSLWIVGAMVCTL